MGSAYTTAHLMGTLNYKKTYYCHACCKELIDISINITMKLDKSMITYASRCLKNYKLGVNGNACGCYKCYWEKESHAELLGQLENIKPLQDLTEFSLPARFGQVLKFNRSWDARPLHERLFIKMLGTLLPKATPGSGQKFSLSDIIKDAAKININRLLGYTDIKITQTDKVHVELFQVVIDDLKLKQVQLLQVCCSYQFDGQNFCPQCGAAPSVHMKPYAADKPLTNLLSQIKKKIKQVRKQKVNTLQLLDQIMASNTGDAELIPSMDKLLLFLENNPVENKQYTIQRLKRLIKDKVEDKSWDRQAHLANAPDTGFFKFFSRRSHKKQLKELQKNFEKLAARQIKVAKLYVKSQTQKGNRLELHHLERESHSCRAPELQL